MKKYKSLIVSSLMATLIIATPIASFAENNNKDKKDNENKMGQLNKVKENKDKKENSWFGSNWFNNHNLRDTTAPVISNVVTTSTKVNKATIKWETDVRSNTFVWYSKVSPVDTSVNPMMKRGDRVLKHKIELKKLEPNTKYYIVVGSANNIGIIKSAEISFTTPIKVITPTPVVVDTTVPVISNTEITVNGSNVVISWKTNETTSSTIFYSTITPVNTTTASITKVVNNTLTKEHSLSIPNLTSNTLYHFIIKSADATNNIKVSGESAFMTNSGL